MATSFSASQFRKKALLSQGLFQTNPFGRGCPGVQKCIDHIGYVQIDTISVIERAHHHVLWTRVSDYQPAMLDRLVADKTVFEYWFHAAAYLPMKDFRFALPRMEAIKGGQKHWFENTDKKLMKHICARIKAEGPLMARDFVDATKKESGWWEWKPAKQALEQLFIQGDLMVVARRGFQKQYDLMERVLPADVDSRIPDLQEQAEHLVDVNIRSHGFAAIKSYTYLRRGANLRVAVKERLEQSVSDSVLLKTELPCNTTVYCDPKMATGKRPANRVLLLSPFDNCVIQRERCRRIFDFDFQIECYLPQAKRTYGYFCLPILYRDKFVGRIDCKAVRKEGLLDILALYLTDEPDLAHEENFLQQLAKSLSGFMRFNACSRIRLKKVAPAAAKKKLLPLLNPGVA